MNLLGKTLLLGAATLFSLGALNTAPAHGHGWHGGGYGWHGGGWHGGWNRGYYHRPGRAVIVNPAPVYQYSPYIYPYYRGYYPYYGSNVIIIKKHHRHHHPW